MTRLRRCAASAWQACLVVVVGAALSAEASAQPYGGTSAPHRGSVEVGGGLLWSHGYDAGSAEATLTRNTTTGSTPLTLFAVDGRAQSGPGAEARVGVYLGRRVSAEGTFQSTRPVLRARVTRDFESAPDTDADETLTSYLVGGSLLYHFGAGRVVPFVAGGGGYLRQLHEANAALLTGTETHGGGGVKVWLGTGRRRLGFRVEALASARSKSVAFEQKRRIVPTFGAGIAYLF